MTQSTKGTKWEPTYTNLKSMENCCSMEWQRATATKAIKIIDELKEEAGGIAEAALELGNNYEAQRQEMSDRLGRQANTIQEQRQEIYKASADLHVEQHRLSIANDEVGDQRQEVTRIANLNARACDEIIRLADVLDRAASEYKAVKADAEMADMHTVGALTQVNSLMQERDTARNLAEARHTMIATIQDERDRADAKATALLIDRDDLRDICSKRYHEIEALKFEIGRQPAIIPIDHDQMGKAVAEIERLQIALANRRRQWDTAIDQRDAARDEVRALAETLTEVRGYAEETIEAVNEHGPDEVASSVSAAMAIDPKWLLDI